MDSFLKLASELEARRVDSEKKLDKNKLLLEQMLKSLEYEESILSMAKKDEDNAIKIKDILDNYKTIIKEAKRKARRRGILNWIKYEGIFAAILAGGVTFSLINMEMFLLLLGILSGVISVVTIGDSYRFYRSEVKDAKKVRKHNKAEDASKALDLAQVRVKNITEGLNYRKSEKAELENKILILEKEVSGLTEKITLVMNRRNKVLELPALETVLEAFFKEDREMVLLRQDRRKG